jgi:hypothetical protein
MSADENKQKLLKLGFSDNEIKKVDKLIEELYDGMRLRRIHDLIKSSKSARDTKQAIFLKEEIMKDRLQYIYFYNEFAKEMCRLYCVDSQNGSNEQSVGKTETDQKSLQDKMKYKDNLHLKNVIKPIDGILNKIKFYNDLEKLPLTFDDKISRFNKYNKISFMRMKIRYFKMIDDIKSTCEKVIQIIGEKTNDPERFPHYIRYIINSIHIAETRAIQTLLEKRQAPKDNMEFLKPAIDAFVKFSNMSKNVNVNINTPLEIKGYPLAQKAGGKNIYNNNIMPRKVVVCRHKSVKKCKRASVSCKYVSGKTRKYCRRTRNSSLRKKN